jgi:hypothetical protein
LKLEQIQLLKAKYNQYSYYIDEFTKNIDLNNNKREMEGLFKNINKEVGKSFDLYS